VILAPILTFFFPGWMTRVLALVPVYWSFHAYDAAIKGAYFMLWFAAGLLAYAIAMVMLGYWFRKKVWRGL